VNVGNCLLKTVLFLVLMPVVLALPPLWFAAFAFITYIWYFCRKG
jgi:hypothetical protein